MLSPLTKGLFKRAILQSGVPNSYLGSHDKAKALEQTNSLATYLKCSTDSMEHILSCLREKSLDEILDADLNLNLIMNPIYGDALMPLNPVNALLAEKFNRDLDLMYGVTRDEGSAFVEPLIMMLKSDKTTKDLTLNETKKIIELIMGMWGKSVADEIVQFYTGHLENPTQADLRQRIVLFCCDV